MKVTRGQIIARGLTHRCPNCGGRTLFRTGTLFELNGECARCGLRFERDEGVFLGSMSLNYGVTLIGFLAPVIALAWYQRLSENLRKDRRGVGLLRPFRRARQDRAPTHTRRNHASTGFSDSLYVFLPQHLPANREPKTDGATGDENG